MWLCRENVAQSESSKTALKARLEHRKDFLPRTLRCFRNLTATGKPSLWKRLRSGTSELTENRKRFPLGQISLSYMGRMDSEKPHFLTRLILRSPEQSDDWGLQATRISSKPPFILTQLPKMGPYPF